MRYEPLVNDTNRLIQKLQILTEEIEGWYTRSNISDLMKDKSITKIRHLDTDGALIDEFPMHVKHITGDCYIYDDVIEQLPDNLTVDGTLVIGTYSEIKKLPNGLKVGSLNVHNDNISELPEDLHVEDFLQINSQTFQILKNIKCKEIRMRSTGLRIIQNLDAVRLSLNLTERARPKLYPDVIVSDGLYINYYRNGKVEYGEFADVFEAYDKFPELIPDGALIDYSDEEMERLTERLEKLTNGDIFITSNPKEVKQKLENGNNDYRILYDRNIGLYMFGDAESYTHWDMIQRAYRDGLYYNMEDFITSLGGTLDNYVEIGQSGNYDGKPTEWIEPYLAYLMFTREPDTLGVDGYNTEWVYSFGNILTRDCDLTDTPLYNVLGTPLKVEKG